MVTEEHVHQAASDQDLTGQTPPDANTALSADAPPIPTEAARRSEELQMLFLGFGTGLTIAGVFLIYLVFAYAKWLP